MSSLWDVVIWTNKPEELLPDLESFAENHDRSAGFLIPNCDSLYMGSFPVITGTVNHLYPQDLLDVISAVHERTRQFLTPTTVLLRSEYDMGGYDQVYRLNEDGTWE